MSTDAAMLEASARARLGRATHTRTAISAQTLDLHVGEEVGFSKQPASKDTQSAGMDLQMLLTPAGQAEVSVDIHKRHLRFAVRLGTS